MRLFGWIKEIKYFFQRGRRGWSDCDWWSVDGYLAEIIPPMIKKLRNSEVQGYPEGWVSGIDEYNEILDHITWTFEQAQKIISYDIIYQRADEWDEEVYQKFVGLVEKGEEHWKDVEVWDKETCIRFEEGFDLFKKFFFSLWD